VAAATKGIRRSENASEQFGVASRVTAKLDEKARRCSVNSA